MWSFALLPALVLLGGASATPSRDHTLAKRAADELYTRDACDTQDSIPNYYNVNITSYDAFKADPTISAIANAAPTPTGYSQLFKNHSGANDATYAYGYLGWQLVQTGYDIPWCAQVCNQMRNCISFNIYFEREPVEEPGTGCENPNPAANVKCSFWNSTLSLCTATDTGSWRRQFHVAVAGSNTYTVSRNYSTQDAICYTQYAFANISTAVVNTTASSASSDGGSRSSSSAGATVRPLSTYMFPLMALLLGVPLLELMS